jgi:hypothetical protein
MPVRTVAGRRVWRRRTPLANALAFTAWVAGGALVVWSLQLISRQTIWMFVLDAPEQAFNLFGRMLPPRWAYAEQLVRPLWDTLNIATVGTLAAVVLAVPVALLAARTTTPHPSVRALALLVIVASRSIHSLVWALVLVFLVGPGVFAGVLAIATSRPRSGTAPAPPSPDRPCRPGRGRGPDNGTPRSRSNPCGRPPRAGAEGREPARQLEPHHAVRVLDRPARPPQRRRIDALTEAPERRRHALEGGAAALERPPLHDAAHERELVVQGAEHPERRLERDRGVERLGARPQRRGAAIRSACGSSRDTTKVLAMPSGAKTRSRYTSATGRPVTASSTAFSSR